MNFYDDQEHDKLLVENAKSGDPASFNVLVEKYHAIAWALAYQWVKNRTDTQDILQIAYLQAYKNLTQLENKHKFFGWFRQIIVNVCKIHKRSHKHLLNEVIYQCEERHTDDPNIFSLKLAETITKHADLF